jgi:transcriptional regulator with GAF, ATPase, and Fis domain
MSRASGLGHDHLEARLLTAAERTVLLADALVGGDPAQRLDSLARTCVDLLDVKAAGVLLRTGGETGGIVAASDAVSLRLEQAQLRNGSGPAFEVLRTAEPVAYTDPADLASRWPAYAASLAEAGHVAVHCVPMRVRDDTVGALELFPRTSGLPTECERRVATVLAAATALGIAHHRRLESLSTLAEQLQRALNNRVVIERAIGVVAEYGGVEMGAAFDAIRLFARRRRTKLSAVAQALTTRQIHPGEVIDTTRRD